MSRDGAYGVRRRCLGLACVAALLCLPTGAAFAAATSAPFALEPPAFLRGPQVATSLMGATYTYLPLRFDADTRLMITTMPSAEIRRRFGTLTELQCIQLFLGELRATHERFFVVAMNEPLTLGPITVPRFRWNGVHAGRPMTGVLSCGELADRYYVVHFVDALANAVQTFPAIRTSLKTLVPVATPGRRQPARAADRDATRAVPAQ